MRKNAQKSTKFHFHTRFGWLRLNMKKTTKNLINKYPFNASLWSFGGTSHWADAQNHDCEEKCEFHVDTMFKIEMIATIAVESKLRQLPHVTLLYSNGRTPTNHLLQHFVTKVYTYTYTRLNDLINFLVSIIKRITSCYLINVDAFYRY